MSDGFEFHIVDPHSPDAAAAMSAYFDELAATFPDGFEYGDALGSGSDSMRLPAGAFVIAYNAGGDVAACGGIQRIDDTTGEIKRMWVAPVGRGKGLGRALLEHLESVVTDLGYSDVVLDTNDTLGPAIAMYETAGYEHVERYNDNPYADHWFRKQL